ncbi:hypothetical protein BHE74_00030415 [Ensete ventricosum]|nr:hypothetical protein BHE74_00030415 [Ensete ventricosum]
MKEQKVTVKGNVKPEDVFQTVSKTGKKTSFWEAEPEAKEAAPTKEDVPSAPDAAADIKVSGRSTVPDHRSRGRLRPYHLPPPRGYFPYVPYTSQVGAAHRPPDHGLGADVDDRRGSQGVEGRTRKVGSFAHGGRPNEISRPRRSNSPRNIATDPGRLQLHQGPEVDRLGFRPTSRRPEEPAHLLGANEESPGACVRRQDQAKATLQSRILCSLHTVLCTEEMWEFGGGNGVWGGPSGTSPATSTVHLNDRHWSCSKYSFVFLAGADADDEKVELILSEIKRKDLTELIATGIEKFASVPSGGGVAVAVCAPGGGGGGAVPAAAEPKKEEKVEEKEESDEVTFAMI